MLLTAIASSHSTKPWSKSASLSTRPATSGNSKSRTSPIISTSTFRRAAGSHARSGFRAAGKIRARADPVVLRRERALAPAGRRGGGLVRQFQDLPREQEAAHGREAEQESRRGVGQSCRDPRGFE